VRALLVFYAWGLQLVGSFMHNTYELLLPLTKLFLCFQNKSSSTKIVIHASLCEGPIFYFIVESFYLLPSILEANTCVNCALILTYLLICIHHITLCWQLSMRYACWKLKATAETYIFLCVASKPLTLNLLLYELALMQVLLILVLKVLFMKSLCYMIQLFSHYLFVSNLLLRITSFTSYALQ